MYICKVNNITLQSFRIIIPKRCFLMISIDKIISINEKLIKTTEGELTFDVIKYQLYANHIHLILSWWQRNILYHPYSISKNEINIIRSVFGQSVSYDSIFLAIFLVCNMYTVHRKGKIYSVTPIQGPVLKDNKNSLQNIFIQCNSPHTG